MTFHLTDEKRNGKHIAYISNTSSARISNSNMSGSVIGILDLPNEIICTIWDKLNQIDILYSMVGVNKRFDRIVRDPIYTRSIQLAETNVCSPLPDSVLNRYCLDVLPRIAQCIECLTLEPSSMERILLSGDYPVKKCQIIPDYVRF